MATIHNRTHSRGFTSLQTAFRTTNFVFKKSRPHFDIEINGLPSFQSLNTKNHNQVLKIPERRRNTGLKIQPTSEISCTNFMKSYIDKLKKERKRQNKKLKETKNSNQKAKRSLEKGKQMFDFSYEEPFYNQPHSNHLLVLEKIPKTTRGILNTISFVSENLDQLNNETQRRQNKNQSPEWTKKQKLDQLIKDIRSSHKKKSVIDQFNEITKKYPNRGEEAQKNKVVEGLQVKKVKNIRIAKIKGNQGNRQSEFRKIGPWKPESNHYQFSIEEYSKDI